jgi:nucleotide-binding universal stress UspA family protein
MSSTKPAPSEKPEAVAGAAAPIVVGFDESREGRDALELARVLCEVRRARCIVATVIEWGPVSVRRALTDAEESEAEPLFEQARKALSGLEVETRVVGTRSPGRMLAELAEREHASTLVLGAPHHRSSAGRALLGSVAEHLLHHSPCAVAIAPRGYGDTSLTHAGLDQVSVAFDGTSESQNALRHAEDLAAAAGATIQILVAKDPLVTGVEADSHHGELGSGEQVLEQAVSSVRDSLQANGKLLEPPGRETVTTVAEVLAKACDGSILVCGSRPAADRILLASVTKRVIEMSVHPVLVVPAAAVK